jgi:hypothetical protein
VLTIRRWHSYLGLLIAPSVVFFALTGALQLFGLHESRGSYKPPALIEMLGSVHKDQVFALGHHGGPPPGAEPDAAEPGAATPGIGSAGPESHEVAPPAADHHDEPADHDEHEDEAALSTTLLKSYFLLVATALATSTGFGVWMGLTQMRRPRVAWTLLIIGTVVPVALLAL